MNNLIYIVEDDKSIRELESYALVNSDFEVREFERGKELFDAMRESMPSLVILDIMLPGDDGLKILRKIRETPAFCDMPIIMVTAKTREIDAAKALDMGADDYISKPFGVMELVSRVKALLRRTSRVANHNLKWNEITIDEQRHTVFVNSNSVDLTYKEYEILKVLVANQGIVLTRELLMEKVWGYDFEQGNRTVDVHIQSLRKKLGASGDNIKTIRNVGYKLGD